MEILDKVYNTFSHLDRDYSRCKTTRTEFILRKFGGDIDIGSMIILDAIDKDTSNSAGYTSEDLKKLSFVKDIFSTLKATRNSWDTLTDFSFKSSGLMQELDHLLQNAEYKGTGVRQVSQHVLNSKERGVLHFRCTASRAEYTPVKSCRVFHAYNENMVGHIGTMLIKPVQMELGAYYTLKGRSSVNKITQIAATKIVKVE